MIHLAKQNKKYEKEYIEAVKNGFWGASVKPADYKQQLNLLRKDFDAWLDYRCDVSRPVILPTGEKVKRIPTSFYWLFDDGVFIGEINIRHWLNEFLKKQGGHIGYSIRKEKQNMGYGTKMLELALKKAKKDLGLKRVLITLEEKNIGSKRVVEKNNGVLDKKVENPYNIYGGRLLRYWIDLT